GTPLDNYGTIATSTGDPVHPGRIDVPFNNYGSLAVQQGPLRLGAGGNAYTGFAGSTVTGAAGTLLVFDGPAALRAGSSVDSAGAVQFAGVGGAAVAGSYSAAATRVQRFEDPAPPPGAVTMTGPVGRLGDVAVYGATLDLT